MRRLTRGQSITVLLVAIWLSLGVATRVAADRVPAPQTGRQDGTALRTWLPAAPVFPANAHAQDPRFPVLAYHQPTNISHLAWEEGGQVRYAWRYAQAWLIDPAVTWRGDSPALALDKEGNPHLVYVDVSIENAQLQVFYTQRLSDTWSLPRNVSSTAGPSTSPDLSIAVQDAIHVVWAERLDRSNRIYHAYSLDSGMTWSQVAPIPGAHGYAPALTTGPRPYVWAVWQGLYQTDVANTSDIWVARWDGSLWSEPVNVSATLDGNAHSPDLVVGLDGTLHIVWEQAWTQGGVAICYLEGSPEQWAGPITLSQGEATQPAMAFDLNRGVAVAWDAGQSLACRRKQSDGTWSGITYFGASASGVRDVTLAPSGPGSLEAIWSARAAEGPGALWSAMQVLPATSTPSPSPTWTPRPTVQPTLPAEPTPTSTPSIQPTIPEPTMSPTLTATWLPSPTPEPTLPLPTVDGPYMAHFPAITKPISEPYYGETHVIREPADARRGQERTASLDDAWRWHDSNNLSSSETESRDATSVWLTHDTALTVWVETYAAFSLLYCSHLENDVWSTPMPFFVGEAPDLAVDADGVAHLVFSNEFGGVYDIFYTTWTGEHWTPSQNISSTSGNSTQPALTIRGDGTPIVVWSDTTEGAHRVYYGWRSEGIWNTFLIRGSLEGSAPDIVVGKNQRVWVTWQALEPWGSYEVYSVWGDGITWQNYAIQISGTIEQDSVAPRLAASPLKGAYLVWQEGAQPDASVYYCDNLGDNYWWALPEELSDEADSAEQPRIAVHNGGQRYVTWDAGDRIAITSRYASASTWISPTVVVSGTTSIGAPDVSLSETAEILVTWCAEPGPGAHDIHAREGVLPAPYALWLPRASESDDR